LLCSLGEEEAASFGDQGVHLGASAGYLRMAIPAMNRACEESDGEEPAEEWRAAKTMNRRETSLRKQRAESVVFFIS
jgi:hypothetical protein